MRLPALLLPAILLSACAMAPEPVHQYGPTVSYACPGGKALSAEFSTDGQALTLHVNNTTHTLLRNVSDDGALYDDSRYSLWVKGDKVRLQTTGVADVRDCHDSSHDSSKADASGAG